MAFPPSDPTVKSIPEAKVGESADVSVATGVKVILLWQAADGSWCKKDDFKP